MSNRISALDLARFFAIVMMIQGHSLDTLTSTHYLDINIFPWTIWNFVRGFTAPMFLIISGAAQVFANKRNENGLMPRDIRKKRSSTAFMLLIIGYIIVFPARRVYDVFFIDNSIFKPFFQTGILQLIAISLFLVLALYAMTRTDKSLGITALAFALLMTVLTPFAQNVNWFKYCPEYIAAYLSYDHGSLFPIFPFLSYMFYGTAYGVLLKSQKVENRNKFLMLYTLLIGLAFVAIGYLITGSFSIMHVQFANFEKANPGATLYKVGFVLMVVSVAAVVNLKLKSIEKWILMFSKRSLAIYIVHIIILFGTPWFSGFAMIYYKHFTLTQSLLLTLIVELFSFASIYIYLISVNKFPFSKKLYRYSITAFLVFSLLI